MPTCASCGAEVSGSNRLCDLCGSPAQAAEITPTEFMPGPDTSSSAAPQPAFEEGRFLPGTLLAGRYRVVGLIGRGGMGEVYRASDLILRQPVALKFLPQSFAANREVLDRFFNEVRVARQVSHPNICRLYDIGEFEGQPYISMEYVDGEDLASLLRRIGRLPADKALEIARRLCAGIAAAHEKGVLHRDLKPSNIMLNSRGQVLLTDFGLAGLAGQFEDAEIRSGTPGYMAPEQLAGREVTPRSDIYSLGAVLYEMFTGKRAFEAGTMAELARLQTQSTPASPVTIVKDLDPAVERVIFRCLEPDPARRPASALSVAAALPGGDPLAAALAAGETPSPDMVAAAGETEATLKPRFAAAILAAVVLGLFLAAFISGRLALLSRTPFDNSPDALALRARELLRDFGYIDRPGDFARGFHYSGDYLRWAAQNGSLGRDLPSGQPAPVVFWYRAGPRFFQPQAFLNEGQGSPGIVTANDPPPSIPGMVKVELDPQGRLTALAVVTPQVQEKPGQPKPFDWNALFAAAGLDPKMFTRAEPKWLPQASWDARGAWTGSWPGGPAGALRVEAAAFEGRPVFFTLIGPWSEAHAMYGYRESTGERASRIITLLLFLSALLWGCGLARRNARLGRGDRRGALRIAGFMFCLFLCGWVLGGSHIPAYYELGMFVMAVSWALFFAALAWVLYLALEPYARRLWPETLIGWSRLLSGGIRDPLVARDVLFGYGFGIVSALLYYFRQSSGEHFGEPPLRAEVAAFAGLRILASSMLFKLAVAVAISLMLFFLMLGLRTALRKQWLAATAFALVLLAAQVPRSNAPALDGAFMIAVLALDIAVLFRLGLLSFIVGQFVMDVLSWAPLTLDFSSWYIGNSVFVLAILTAIVAYAFRTALAGRRVFLDD